MRVLVAPDKFAGTLTAVEAATAIAEGWRRRAPDDELDLAPMADGGPGFVDVLHAALGGELLVVTVEAVHGEQVPATILRVEDTAYVESSQSCGLHLLEGGSELATTLGVGELLLAAVESGARRIVVGLGGAGTNDGGAGLLAQLGATSDGILDCGAMLLDGITSVDLAPAKARLEGIELVAATDVDIPLTGLFGTTKAFGAERGIREDLIPMVDGWLEEFAVATDRRMALEKGAGAGGGVGYALLCLGARQRARHRHGRDRRTPGRASPRRRPGGHRRGRLRLLEPLRQGAVRRRRGGRGGAAALRRPGRAGAGGFAGDARARCGVGVLPRGPGGGGARVRRPSRLAGRARRARGAHLVQVTANTQE